MPSPDGEPPVVPGLRFERRSHGVKGRHVATTPPGNVPATHVRLSSGRSRAESNSIRSVRSAAARAHSRELRLVSRLAGAVASTREVEWRCSVPCSASSALSRSLQSAPPDVLLACPTALLPGPHPPATFGRIGVGPYSAVTPDRRRTTVPSENRTARAYTARRNTFCCGRLPRPQRRTKSTGEPRSERSIFPSASGRIRTIVPRFVAEIPIHGQRQVSTAPRASIDLALEP